MSEPHFQTAFPASEFADRRRRLAELVARSAGPKAVAVVQGAAATGAFDAFRQSNEFLYLTGVEVPHAVVRIEAGTGRTTLYLPRLDAAHERSEGAYLNCDDPATAARLTGADDVRPPEALAGDLAGAAAVLTPSEPAETRQASRDTLRRARKETDADPWDGRPSREAWFADRLRAAATGAALGDLSPILDRLRLYKTAAEIAVMRRAGRITARAIVEAMRATRPGVPEHCLAAVADYVFAVGGAQGAGYRAIVAGGANIWNAHYWRNNCRLADGDWVLMDYAPDLDGYTSDIGRMWPVNGRYADWQRELYGFVVAYHRALLRRLRPGVMPATVLEEAAADMAPAARRKWSAPEFAQAAEEMLRFRGHLTHPVGMAVHDVGSYRDEPLRPGLVFALDPQMWVPGRRLYVRVEDTVLITADGCEAFTGDAPAEPDAVEALMARRRTDLLSAFPPDDRAGQAGAAS
jgi:Xaa-Pro aminopeptidase